MSVLFYFWNLLLQNATSVIFGVAIFLAIFSAFTVTHELGHILFAKFSKHRPTTVTLGSCWYIPRFHFFGVAFIMSLLPIGGSVAYLGEQPDEVVPLNRKSWLDEPWRRFVTAIGGPLVQIVVALAALFCVQHARIGEPSNIWLLYNAELFVAVIAWAVDALFPTMHSDGGHMLRAVIKAPHDARLQIFNPVYRLAFRTVLVIGTGLVEIWVAFAIPI